MIRIEAFYEGLAIRAQPQVVVEQPPTAPRVQIGLQVNRLCQFEKRVAVGVGCLKTMGNDGDAGDGVEPLRGEHLLHVGSAPHCRGQQLAALERLRESGGELPRRTLPCKPSAATLHCSRVGPLRPALGGSSA